MDRKFPCDLTVNKTINSECISLLHLDHTLFTSKFLLWSRVSSCTMLSATLAAMLFIALSCDYRSTHSLIRFHPGLIVYERICTSACRDLGTLSYLPGSCKHITELRWISTWCKMSQARHFPFVCGALKCNRVENY